MPSLSPGIRDRGLMQRSVIHPLPNDLRKFELWLRAAIRMQCCGGPWENGFPRCVWYKAGDTVFQGRLVNRVSGQHKGWQLVVPDDGNRVAQCE